MKVGQVQRLYTEHPEGMKRKSVPVRNHGKDTSPTSSQALTPAALTQWRCVNLPNSGNPKLYETTDMPKLGEVRIASEIGYRGHALYKYTACDTCGKERWVRIQDISQEKGLICRSCGYPSSNFFLKKLKELQEAGAKRASELGKPVLKNRDPWYYPHQCKICGKAVWHQKKDLHRACSDCAYIVRNTSSGEEHPNWKGGRYISGDYILVKVQPDSPYFPMTHATGYVLEHRLVMAMSIGRCLEDSEVVHHIDGNRQHNEESNLELLPNNHEHLPYILLQQQMAKLEMKVKNQGKEIKLLKWHIREIEQGNPELAGSGDFRASVVTLQETPLEGEEKVHPHEKS